MKKIRTVAIIALILLAAVAVTAFAADGTDGELSQFAITITTFLAGTLGVWLVQLLKKILPWGLGEKLMAWIAYGVAFIVAIVAFAIAGGLKSLFTDTWTAIQGLMATGGFMALAYATLKGNLGIKSKSQLKGR